LDPEAFELRSSMNTPNMRTTFYSSTNGIEETADLLKLRKKHRNYKKSRDEEAPAEPVAPATPAAPAASGDKKEAKPALAPEKVHTLDPEAY